MSADTRQLGAIAWSTNSFPVLLAKPSMTKRQVTSFFWNFGRNNRYQLWRQPCIYTPRDTWQSHVFSVRKLAEHQYYTGCIKQSRPKFHKKEVTTCHHCLRLLDFNSINITLSCRYCSSVFMASLNAMLLLCMITLVSFVNQGLACLWSTPKIPKRPGKGRIINVVIDSARQYLELYL